ncbi:geranylgeranyl pyrophosphate synthetase [Pseudovirgaria hyperparasitica]|uniref:Geranylgeranyl pyrophosphate synthetase n=1 Tax=Pseudovirgaria hyperparasitica TaxID=470096 RepID=A0A6A6WC10_9PEZI|nr:geranylgeranyl pyrophosphate synthetase [Pseudovirgaria hyperparasitica]KAF2760115.1 geranylgeranyl pyrophosphate synthetase [Pseudovirgaria hyperparasitica]
MAPSILAEITRPDLEDTSHDFPATITDLQHLSSYNWIETKNPTIAVPGCPNLWTGLRRASAVKKDSGLIYISQNAARHPDSPLEPLFRALYLTQPSFDITTVDLVSDRNNLRKLLSFVDPNTPARRRESFTIRVECVKDTIVFCREDTAATTYIGKNEFMGYGHSFEEACTENQVEHGTGHHRIVSYTFHGLKLLVRFETDGYVLDKQDQNPHVPSPSKSTSTCTFTPPAHDDEASLDALLQTLTISPSQPPTPLTFPAFKLTIHPTGRTIAASSILEIKTRVQHKPIPLAEIAPQLWLSQTPKLVRAYHERGTFGVSCVEDVAGELAAWEKGNEGVLRGLGVLIRRIGAVVRRVGSGVVRFDEGGDRLVVWDGGEGERMLPGDLYARWDGV